MTDSATQRAIVEADVVDIDCRLELLNPSNEVIADLSGDMAFGQVEHGNFRTIHRTVRLGVARPLDWGRHRVRPVMLISGGGFSDEVSLGVFALTSPQRPSGEQPVTYQVDGYDLLYLLDHGTDRTLKFDTSSDVLTHVRLLLHERGFPDDRLDNSAAGLTLTSPLIVPVNDDRSWLTVVNELLASINYRGLSIDADGFPSSSPYVLPSEQTPLWTYDATSPTTTVSDDGVITDEFTDAPNVWAFWRSDITEGIPTIGDGLFYAENLSDGPTSIEARGGLRVTRKEGLEVTSQAVLESTALRMIAEDKNVPRRLSITTGPNPYHSHFDVVRIVDEFAGIGGLWQHISWRLDILDPDVDMEHEFRNVA